MAGLTLGSKNELEDIENDVDGEEVAEGDAEGDRSGNYDDPVSYSFLCKVSLKFTCN